LPQRIEAHSTWTAAAKIARPLFFGTHNQCRCRGVRPGQSVAIPHQCP
jgi:hypothetical protein